jgi:transposase-like protein
MSQHFLLSARARTLSLTAVARMSEDEARATFQAIRWAATDGQPQCPRCGCMVNYPIAGRNLWKCRDCRYQFSVTSGTIFASRKLPIRDYLLATAIFVNAVKGISALQLGRDLDVQYKTAFVLAHKLREAIGAGQGEGELSGTVEVDGAYFGAAVRPENKKEDRTDHRLSEEREGRKQSLVVARERGGRTLPVVVAKESDAISFVRQHVAPGATVHADEAPGWDRLHAYYEMMRINHSVAYSLDGACTNQAESFFSRMRRAEIGQHHHISGKYLISYAREMAWKEDYRRVDNGAQHTAVTGAALAHPVSRQWCGYWQRGR